MAPRRGRQRQRLLRQGEPVEVRGWGLLLLRCSSFGDAVDMSNIKVGGFAYLAFCKFAKRADFNRAEFASASPVICHLAPGITTDSISPRFPDLPICTCVRTERINSACSRSSNVAFNSGEKHLKMIRNSECLLESGHNASRFGSSPPRPNQLKPNLSGAR